MTDETQEQVTQAIKPCPFCGGPARSHLYVRDGGKVQCTNPECYGSVTAYDPDCNSKAIAAWNQRTEPQDASRPSDPLGDGSDHGVTGEWWGTDSEGWADRAGQLGKWFAEYAEHHRAKAEAIDALPGSEAWAKVERNLRRARYAYTLQDDIALRTQEARPLHRCPTSNDPDLEGPRTARPEAGEQERRAPPFSPAIRDRGRDA